MSVENQSQKKKPSFAWAATIAQNQWSLILKYKKIGIDGSLKIQIIAQHWS
jgi:hypothetical protein